MARVQLLLAALLLAGAGTMPSRCDAAAVTPAEQSSAEDRVDAEADADPGTGGSSFFDTFMAFLGSSALHKTQAADDGQGEDSVVAAASDTQQQQVEQGRSLYGGGLVAGAPLQDGGQADRVKRTGALPVSLLSGVVNHKLGYLSSKGSHHVHFHNYNTKCDKPHFSLWEFKKAILHKLLEAAKAVGGGVLALKGKLLTAKGHLVAAKGRKLATKGEELTEFGKGVLAKALGHGDHTEEVHHSAPSAPSGPAAPAHYAAYGAPPLAAAHFQGYNYPAPQYLPAAGGAPSGHGYNAAVSLLDEYSRAGFGHAPAHAPGTLALYASQDSSAHAASPSQPLVLAPEYMDAMSTAEMSNKVRRYASRRSIDLAMAAVVRGLQGSDLLLHPDILRSAATRIAGNP